MELKQLLMIRRYVKLGSVCASHSCPKIRIRSMLLLPPVQPQIYISFLTFQFYFVTGLFRPGASQKPFLIFNVQQKVKFMMSNKYLEFNCYHFQCGKNFDNLCRNCLFMYMDSCLNTFWMQKHLKKKHLAFINFTQ